MTSNGKLTDWGKLYRAKRCPRCYGKGRAVTHACYSSTAMSDCSECGGDGVQLVPASGILINPSDDEVKWILGRPCFWRAPYAHVLRLEDATIPTKAEGEQAAVIAWMLRLYQQHRSGWRAEAARELRAIHAKHEPEKATPSTAKQPLS